jgi:hypothetical protein
MEFLPLLIQRNVFQHPRVRYAACNAVGQMATDFAPGFQKKFHEKVCNKSSVTEYFKGREGGRIHISKHRVQFSR